MEDFALRTSKIDFTENLSDTKFMKFPHCATQTFHTFLFENSALVGFDYVKRRNDVKLSAVVLIAKVFRNCLKKFREIVDFNV